MNTKPWTREHFYVAPTVYALTAVVGATLFLVQGLETNSEMAFVVPLICLLFSFRWRVISYGVPAAIFGCILLHAFLGTPMTGSLAFAAITTLVALWRYQTCVSPSPPPAVISSVNRSTTPVATCPFPQSLSLRHAGTALVILVAWFGADILCAKLTAISANPEQHAQYAELLKSRVGLIPEAYLGMRLLFTLALLIWFANTFFSYARVRGSEEGVAEMHLRSELWKWDGDVQRAISKQLRRQSTKTEQRTR